MIPEPTKCAACGRPVNETGVPLSPSTRILHATCWPGGGERSTGSAEEGPAILTGPRSPGQASHPEVDEATQTLLAELVGTPTDLARLLRRAIRKQAAVLVVSADTIREWDTRASEAWAKTQHWLDAHGMRLVVLERGSSGDTPWNQPPLWPSSRPSGSR
jgi:hypothetical protein